MRLRPLSCCLLLLLATGCSGMRLLDLTAEAREAEKRAEGEEQAKEFAAAERSYAEAERVLDEALVNAEGRKQGVLISYVTTKLSIVSAGRARCLQPDNNPAGSWEQAMACFQQSADYAERVQLLKLKRNALRGKAYCLWPTRNPSGSWAVAAGLYAETAELSKGFDDGPGEAEDLRNQALCMLEGAPDGELPKPVRRLLIRARTLGDTDAADLLAEVGGRWCVACSTDLEPEARFCPKCGQDQGEIPE